MSSPFPVHVPLEKGRWRKVLFAVEVLDAVTLERLSEGLEVEADGLRGKPRRNVGGVFVWLDEDLTPLRKVTVDPQRLPYEPVELPRAALKLPPETNVVELPPRTDYPFTAGITGMRGALFETRPAPPSPPTPVAGAEVRLRWLDEDGTTWRDAPTAATARKERGKEGDFVAFVRFAPGDAPKLDAKSALSVRVVATRGGATRTSAALALPLGHVADPSTYEPGADALLFAWDELTP